MNHLKICQIYAREILDSRGNPTVETVVRLSGGAIGRASAPSGASKGSAEAKELRDQDPKRYNGMGVQRAVEWICGPVAQALCGRNASQMRQVDLLLQKLDGTPDKSHMGANVTLTVSLACAKAASTALGTPLCRFVGGCGPLCLPLPAMNVLNGGVHANNNLDIQEFLLLPLGAPSYSQALRWCVEIYHTLGALLQSQGYSTAVGDEGGFAPNFVQEKVALDYLLQAIEKAGYRPGIDVFLGMDAASSSWYQAGVYQLPKSGKRYTSQEMISYWEELTREYPIAYLEDGLGESDWGGWQQLTQRLGDRVLLVGDDLFVTNPVRLSQGIRQGCANAALIKPNQIGTLTETLEAVQTAAKGGYAWVFSHRSGETNDSCIADLAVATGAKILKGGAPARGERVAKYNQLLRLEQMLGKGAPFALGQGKTLLD